jgi:hypothetical protein
MSRNARPRTRDLRPLAASHKRRSCHARVSKHSTSHVDLVAAPNDGYGRGKSVSRCPRTRGISNIGLAPQVPVWDTRSARSASSGCRRRTTPIALGPAVGAPSPSDGQVARCTLIS